MQNIKLTIEYDGRNFKGWQIQGKGERTVQDEIIKAYRQLFKETIKLSGAGRTDSGVSALGQVANFHTQVTKKPAEIRKALNATLPDDIVILKTQKVDHDFHAQYSAKEKSYRYLILNRKTRSALHTYTALHYRYPLNIALMRSELKDLLGRHDFKSFQSANRSNLTKTTIRTIRKAQIVKKGDLVEIRLTADGFLYRMVRNIVGTLLEIGSGKLPKSSIKQILGRKNRIFAGTAAKAHGLALVSVKY